MWQRSVPEAVRPSMELWVGCVAGALELTQAGFESGDLELTRSYRAEDARHFLEDAGMSDEAVLRFEAHANGGSTEQDLRYAKGRLA